MQTFFFVLVFFFSNTTTTTITTVTFLNTQKISTIIAKSTGHYSSQITVSPFVYPTMQDNSAIREYMEQWQWAAKSIE